MIIGDRWDIKLGGETTPLLLRDEKRDSCLCCMIKPYWHGICIDCVNALNKAVIKATKGQFTGVYASDEVMKYGW